MLEKYPLLKLKLLGSICPCLEKEENCAARQAAWSLSSVQVRWHRKLRGASSSNGNTTSSSMGGFISGMFGGGSTSSSGGAAVGGGTYDPVKGTTLSVVDAPTGPQLLISSSISSAGLRSKKIPLKCIKKVQTQKAGGILNSSSSRSSIEIIDNTNREILRFDVLQSAGVPIAVLEDENEENWDNNNNLEDATEEIRDDIIDHLDIIIEWERRRQAYIVTLGEEDPNSTLPQYVNEYDDDDDNDIDGTPTSPKSGRKMGGALAEKAQSIKHFAEREIEMQKMKKEREARKAKYVKEAGGLKYTAIAMANRS